MNKCIAVLNVILAVIAGLEIVVGFGALIAGAWPATVVAFIAASLMIWCID
jgi:hypothetical protein